MSADPNSVGYVNPSFAADEKSGDVEGVVNFSNGVPVSASGFCERFLLSGRTVQGC